MHVMRKKIKYVLLGGSTYTCDFKYFRHKIPRISDKLQEASCSIYASHYCQLRECENNIVPLTVFCTLKAVSERVKMEIQINTE